MGRLTVKNHPDYKTVKTQPPPTIKLRDEYRSKLIRMYIALGFSIVLNIAFMVKLYGR
jgi:hypothetical protein